MIFDVKLSLLQQDVAVGEDHLEIINVLGLGLPMGPNQVMPIPAGIARLPMSKSAAQELINNLQEAVDQLPDEKPQSDIVIANNLQGAQAMAEQIGKFR